ncbi:MmgE/PrpD family protein [Nocardioides immobilis]|uniref:MmgE/PrpD family protein n=1 Tax=Nocardioides immobilis TaxID=2049295 RepID=A0A417XTI8_9ACTN|nr:MmgE/PrpD family protein [Nocardioides immobilis]RHW23788.1 MmgE/PrpD family protein [Nocardioides immobilis]
MENESPTTEPTVVHSLADFGYGTTLSTMPESVVGEAKRVLLDSIGCALAGRDELKGKAGRDLAALSRAAGAGATVIGEAEQSSVMGAAFANAELVSALDFDAILAPGHVAPVVIPVALAMGEVAGSSGRDVLTAIAVGHEVSCRVAFAMDGLRDVVDGTVARRPVVGYSAIVFGATAASAKLMAMDSADTADSIAIAASIAPVHSQGPWAAHVPVQTIKYMVAGTYAQTALTAAYLSRSGHRGDLQILEDADVGYPRFVGSSRWEKDVITADLGDSWRFPDFQTYKPYPHCRVLHGQLDILLALINEHDLKPDEIAEIRSWGEEWHRQPIWLNTRINHVIDAQNSMAHGLALAAHRIKPSKQWQSPDIVFSESVMGLMSRVVTAAHPAYTGQLDCYPNDRPARVEIDARGTTFVGEGRYPKGTPSPDPSTKMTTEELVAKFRTNADGILPAVAIDTVIDTVLGLESVDDIRELTRLLRP